MLQTPIHKRHLELGAKMVSFAGYDMPVMYAGINSEHEAVRTAAGLFDVSHMGEFIVEGPQAEAFLQRMTINDVSVLEAGQAQYSALCNESGGIIDDLLIYRYKDFYMVVVNAANIQSDFEWLNRNLPSGVILNDISEKVGLIALQGPSSRDIISMVTGADVTGLPYYHFVERKLNGVDVTVARTGYTGELGFEIYSDSENILGIWDLLTETGRDSGLVPAGLGCRDTLRMEMKYCLYGNDIDESTCPHEAGLGWITKLDKGDFIGREAILASRQDSKRRLVCLEMIDRAIPRKGYPVRLGAEKIGSVTSGTQSPSLKKGIALAYVDMPYHKSGTEVSVEIRDSLKKAVIVKPPFYKNGTVMI